ncbi:MAG: hypothetical protein U0946_00700 [Patescibacteria group bacterium]|nr:hypothetical protein [Patescibacteria group bacterium]
MPDIFVSENKKGASLGKTGMGARYETVADRLAGEKNKNKLNSFLLLPKKVKFENQETREKIILLLRRHWVTQIKWVILGVIGLGVPLIFTWVPLLDFLPGNYQFMALIFWYLLLLAYVYENFISWYYQVFIITDERIIDINFTNLIYKEVSEAKIDNIEDVTYIQGGVLRAMFNFGDVVMQTAGEKREFMIEAAPEPNRVVKIMNDLKLEEEHEKIVGKVR